MLGDPSLHTSSNKNDGKSLTHALLTLQLRHPFTEKKLKNMNGSSSCLFLRISLLKVILGFYQIRCSYIRVQGRVCKGHGCENSRGSWLKLQMQDLHQYQFCFTKIIKISSAQYVLTFLLFLSITVMLSAFLKHSKFLLWRNRRSSKSSQFNLLAFDLKKPRLFGIL